MINWRFFIAALPRDEEEEQKVYFVEAKYTKALNSQFIIALMPRKSICDMEWKLIAISKFAALLK